MTSSTPINLEVDVDPLNANGLCLPKTSSSKIVSADPDESTFVIKSPEALRLLGTLATSDEMIRFAHSETNPGNITIPFSQIRRLHVCIMAPIPAEPPLDAEEMNGGIRGDTISALVKGWQEAFRMIPAVHQIEEMVFDMRCEQRPELRHIMKLLQQVSTVLWLKAQKNRESRRIGLRCRVVGCGDEKRKWLEAALPGEKAETDAS